MKNLPKTVTQEQLKKLFEHHGKITKVVLPASKSGQERNRIGFVHFSERSSAMKALKNTENYELDGNKFYNVLSVLIYLCSPFSFSMMTFKEAYKLWMG